ncbi:PspC domain-containing protein [Xylanimonas ulmi]|uniref:Phage shock protein C (PspC) family protein n=1 Tax=Xylanimonas ulmi TaxID=228973 RepID=A0A4Q7M7X9_9MICO|nr:PspC domain-containing protein [Xylanibacterium ulmi]RZS63223.1 phage shock protein C (PspC) family protein [Xylanibacterium ulmi]
MSTNPFPPQPGTGPDAASAGTPVPPGSPPYEPYPGPPPSGGDRFFDSIRRSGLARSEDRWVGGVCAGVAHRLGWDPLLVRGIVFISFFLTGVGLVAYALAWALLPERRDGRIHLQQAIRGDFDVALLGAAAAFVVGIGWSRDAGFWWDGWGWVVGLFWVAFWVGVVWLVIWLVRDRRHKAQAGPHAGSYAGPTGPLGPTSAAAFTAPADGVTAPATPPSGPLPSGPLPSQPPVPPMASADPRAQAAWSRAEAERARSAARVEAANARTQAAQSRARAAREEAHARAEIQRQRAQERAAQRASKPVTRSAGAGTVGVVFGLLLLTGALLLAQQRSGLTLPWPFNGGFEPILAWVGAALVIVGAAIVVSGVRGRSSGWLGFLAIVGLVVAVPWSIGTSGDTFPLSHISRDVHGNWRGVEGRGVAVGEGTFTPRSVSEAERGFRVQFGDATIDLSSLDLSEATTDDPVEVPIQLTAGDLTVVVPPDSAIEADVRLLAGQIVWDVDDETRTLSRVGSTTAYLTSDEASDDGATLRLLVSAGAGNVTVTEKD